MKKIRNWLLDEYNYERSRLESSSNKVSQKILQTQITIKISPIAIVVLLLVMPIALFLSSKEMNINNLNATYKSWFSKTSIKKIESIDVFYIPFLPILNTVTITGRGLQKIRMSFVKDPKSIRAFTEKFDNLLD